MPSIRIFNIRWDTRRKNPVLPFEVVVRADLIVRKTDLKRLEDIILLYTEELAAYLERSYGCRVLYFEDEVIRSRKKTAV